MNTGTTYRWRVVFTTPAVNLYARELPSGTEIFVGSLSDANPSGDLFLGLFAYSGVHVHFDNVNVVPLASGKPAVLASNPLEGTLAAEADSTAAFPFALVQSYPNPSNPSTTIAYSLGEQAPVRLVIYNLLGQEVRRLVDAVEAPGKYTVLWDGRDERGRDVATGVYVYRMTAGAFTGVKKMVLVK